MPPIRAASVRFIPSRTAASDKRRRLRFAFFTAAASRRSSSAEKSVRNFTADAMARILPAPSNQLKLKKGIPHESKRTAVGIKYIVSFGPRIWLFEPDFEIYFR